MNILLLGSGGREHAFAWKIKQSPIVNKLFIAPGNAGTHYCGQNTDINIHDFAIIKQFVLNNHIEMIVAGSEDLLVKGIHDYFKNDPELLHVKVIGPEKKAAILEGSKDFAKRFMNRHSIPTARYLTIFPDTIEKGMDYLKKLNPPYVIKADGLAAGKGVIICDTVEMADNELSQILLHSKFGNAGAKVVIEEFLTGIELSVFVLTDGKSYLILPSAKDYKRIGEGDHGLNTGGMGAVSPVPFADEIFMEKVESRIIIPTINGLKEEHIPYKGFIFFGLMNVKGEPYVIEYNVRMGDPEAEAVIPRIKSDIVDLFIAVANEKLHEKKISTDDRAACTVMLVSGGYPGEYKKGMMINGLSLLENSIVFHAGSKINNADQQIYTNGGRVLAVTALGNSIADAVHNSYSELNKISFNGMYYRRDIGRDLMDIKET